MHRATHVALILAALALTGCSSAAQLTGTASSASPEPPRESRSAELPIEGVSTKLPKVGDEMRAFRSPSGNIVCRLDERSARCDIGDYAYDPPPRPEGCGKGWGGTLLVTAQGAEFTCRVASLAGKSPELAYGRSTIVGDVGCTSARTGVTCIHLESERGFTVSRERTGTF